MKNRKLILSAASLLFFSTLAMSKGSSPQSQQYGWSAGIATVIPSSPYIEADKELNVFPIVSYTGERFYFQGPKVGYKFYKDDDASMTAILKGTFTELEINNNPELEGIKEKGFALLAGIEIANKFTIGKVSAAIFTDIQNKHDSQSAELTLSNAIWKTPSYGVDWATKITYLASDYANYYYGVSSKESKNSQFEQYDVGSAVIPSVGVNGYYRLARNWTAVYSFDYSLYPSEIKDSPIIEESNSLTGFAGILFKF